MPVQATITIEGIRECLNAFQGLETDLRRTANGRLRDVATHVADGIRENLPGWNNSSAPQADAIVEAARVKRDRIPAVAVPGVKPALSGLKKTPVSGKKGAYKIGIPVENPQGRTTANQFHAPAKGSMVGRNKSRIEGFALPQYTYGLAKVMREWGL